MYMKVHFNKSAGVTKSPHQVNISSKSSIETLEKSVKYAQK